MKAAQSLLDGTAGCEGLAQFGAHGLAVSLTQPVDDDAHGGFAHAELRGGGGGCPRSAAPRICQVSS